MRLKDKVAIITGGAQSIGRAYAVRFADEGAKVVIADINLEAANATVKVLKEKGAETLAIRTDVSRLEDTQEMAKKTAERFGKIDILINNAAIFKKVEISRKRFYELDLDEWNRVMAVTVTGSFLCSRAVFPYFKAQGGGKIINVASSQFFRGAANYAHYVASKGGVIGLTRSLAREMGEFNINVNCIAPGGTLTDPSNAALVESHKKAVIPRRSIARIEYPEDLVGTAVFLASSDSDFITGHTIVVDGGDVMI